MRKSIFSIALLLIIQTTASSQCIPDSIVFSSQQQIDNFQIDYPGCTEIIGRVEIFGDNITNLQGLSPIISVGGDLRIIQNPLLNSLSGLDSLNTIGGQLWLIENPALATLSGLESLTSVGDNIELWTNNSLTNLAGLDGLISIGGSLRIWQNANLVGLSELANLDDLGATLSIHNNDALINLTGLENLTHINGLVEIGSNDVLSGLTGLDNIDAIDGLLLIRKNDSLIDLSGLEGMTSIGGELIISNNFSLTSLAGLDEVNSVGGNLEISYDTLLTDLSSLGNLTSIDGYLEIRRNGSLTGLSGLENIDATTIDSLILRGNLSLMDCEVKSVCDFLALPESITNIQDNGPRCQTRTQIEFHCELLSVSEVLFSAQLAIYPNPFSNSTTIEYELHQSEIVQISIFNHLCKQVNFIQERQSPGKQQFVWEAKELPSGMYYLTIQIGNERAQGKMLIVR